MKNNLWNFDLGCSLEQYNEFKRQEIFDRLMDELRIHLSFHFKKEGYIVENVKFLNLTYNESIGSGHLDVQYDQVYYNSCLNINTSNQASLQLKFEWNSEIISIYPPVSYERDGDEI